MQLKLPALGGIGLKAARGLAYHEEAYAARPVVINVGAIIAFLSVPLRVGEETPVVVGVPGLPPNANVRSARARLTVIDASGETPAPSTVTVKAGDAPPQRFEISQSGPPGLQNVTIRLDQGEVFWTKTGSLPPGEYELPDFAEHLNAYLDRANPQDGQVSVTFLVKSDAPGSVRIAFDEVDYSLVQTQTWENPLDETIRVDRNIEVSFGTVERLPLDALHQLGSRPMVLTSIRLDVAGELGEERLFGDVPEHDGREFATVDSAYSVAQAIQLELPLRVVGVAGLLQAEADAELYIELQRDAAGSPASGQPLAKGNLTLAAAGEGSADAWQFVSFESAAELAAGEPYWIVIKGIRGRVRLGLDVGSAAAGWLGRAVMNRGGQLWKPLAGAAPIAALLRPVYLPAIDNQSAAIELSIERTPHAQRVDPGPRAETITFSFDAPSAGPAVLVLRSHARGVVSVANVIQEYEPS